MNENIDLTEILKDCPKGTKLYSSVYGKVEFLEVCPYYTNLPIKILVNNNITPPYTTFYTKSGKHLPGFDKAECALFPSKDQRDWGKFNPKKPKFDPKTLQPFDKVLARMSRHSIWTADLVSFISCTYFKCVGGYFENCIPYNEETKHLIGTRDEAPEYYRYWKD